MITTSGSAFALESGSQVKYDGASIICQPSFYELTAVFNITLLILDSSTGHNIASGRIEVTPSEVDAQTGSGSGETAPWFSALQLAVKAKLVAINGSTTFTIV